MISNGWIISHRCSWITVYVLCYNSQVNLIVILMTCTCIACILYSVNCPTVICLISMLFIFMETPLVNCGPQSMLLHSYYRLLSTSIIYFLANKYLLPHNTFNHLFTANWWDWQLHCKLGQSTLVALYAGSTLLLVPELHPDRRHKQIVWSRRQAS
jgi:hypothetical protein